MNSSGPLPEIAKPVALADVCLGLRGTGTAVVGTRLSAGDVQIDPDDLVRRVNGVAASLRAQEPAGGRLVGISAHRSPAGVISVLGALAARIPFTPLTGPPSSAGSRRPYLAGIVSGADASPDGSWRPVLEPVPGATDLVPTDAVYVMETSGTTLDSSAAVVGRNGLRHVFAGLRQELAEVIPVGARWTHAHPLTFGFSMCEILGAITFEGDVVVVPGSSPFSSGEWRRHAHRPGLPVVACITPSELAVLCGQGSRFEPVGSHLYLILSGEAAHKAPLRELFAQTSPEWLTVVNTYAATETSGQIAIDVVSPATVGRTVGGYVGKPLPGVQVELVAGPSEVSEITVSGPTVGLGYLNPARTAERFDHGSRGTRFATRDIGEWTADGGLTVTGRASRVVKLGARWLNLDDAERRAGALSGVREVACLLHTLQLTGQTSISTLLVAVVLSQRLPARAMSELRRTVVCELAVRATVEMVVLDELPRTANGKTDHRALVARARRGDDDASHDVTTRRTVIRAWTDVLGAGVALDVDLFDLGVDSLGVVAVAAELTARLGRVVKPEFLLSHPTVAKQIEAFVYPKGERGSRRARQLQDQTRISERRRMARVATRTQGEA